MVASFACYLGDPLDNISEVISNLLENILEYPLEFCQPAENLLQDRGDFLKWQIFLREVAGTL
jgi:hypothetical protein